MAKVLSLLFGKKMVNILIFTETTFSLGKYRFTDDYN